MVRSHLRGRHVGLHAPTLGVSSGGSSTGRLERQSMFTITGEWATAHRFRTSETRSAAVTVQFIGSYNRREARLASAVSVTFLRPNPHASPFSFTTPLFLNASTSRKGPGL